MLFLLWISEHSFSLKPEEMDYPYSSHSLQKLAMHEQKVLEAMLTYLRKLIFIIKNYHYSKLRQCIYGFYQGHSTNSYLNDSYP